MLQLIPHFQYDSVDNPDWNSIAVISWSSDDQNTANTYRLKVATKSGEFLSKLTFFSMVADDRNRLRKYASDYELQPNHPGSLGLPTLVAINKEQVILYEIVLYPVDQKERATELTQFIVKQQPTVRPYGGYNQSNDPLYGYPREEFELGSQSPQYSMNSPVYEPRYDSDI
jgi:hypothetical protein